MANRKGTQERRAAPNFRAVVQDAYEKFKAALTASGASDITKKLDDAPRVEDVMCSNPVLVRQLLKMAWELRAMPDLSGFLQPQEGDDDLVPDRQTPIKPCGRNFDQVMISHLYGCARLMIKKAETDWVDEQMAGRDDEDAKAKAPKGKAKGAAKKEKPGIMSKLMSSFGGGAKDPRADLAKRFPGYGLYDIIKPYLVSESQFELVPYYAQMSSRQAQAVSTIFDSLSNHVAFKKACTIEPKALTNLLQCATVYSEVLTRQDDSKALRESAKEKKEDSEQAEDPLHGDEIARERDFRDRVRRRAAEVFEYLLTSQSEVLDFVIENGLGSENAIRKMAPIYKEETWSVIMDADAVENVVNCPENILAVLGKNSRYLRTEISGTLGQLKDTNIARDVMLICRQEWKQDKLSKYLSEDRYLNVWTKLPSTFNNRFTYQHDARSGQREVKNFQDLKMIVAGMFTEMTDIEHKGGSA